MNRYVVNNSQVEACYIRLYTNANTYTQYDFDFGYSVLLPETVTYIAFCNAYSNFYLTITINESDYQGSSAVTAATEIAEAENGYYTVTSLENLGVRSSSYFAIPLEAIEYSLLANLNKGGYTVTFNFGVNTGAYYLLAGETEYRFFYGDTTGVYTDTIDNVVAVYFYTTDDPSRTSGVALGNYTGTGTKEDPWVPLEDGCIFHSDYSGTTEIY